MTGRGEAANFTRLEWVRAWLLREMGIDPYPGTLNLVLDADDRRAWTSRGAGERRLEPPDPQWCGARCHAVRVNDMLPAAIVVPEVPEYPPDQVEIVASIALREALSLSDGVRMSVQSRGPLSVRAVIFDVDGTLVDSLTAFRVVAERAAAPHGFSITEAVVREALNTSRHFWDLVVPPEQADRARMMEAMTRAAARMWPEVLREHGRVFPDAVRLLRELRGRGYVLGIVTGSRRGSIAPLEDAGALDLFDAVITGEQVERRKPDPEGLLMCVDALGVAPEDAVYVGDTPLDIQAARAAGMGAVGVLTGACDSAGLTVCGADHIVSSLERVAEIVSLRT